MDRILSTESAGSRKPFAVHDPDTVIRDLALTLVLGGDCLVTLTQLRDKPGLCARVGSARIGFTLPGDAGEALELIPAHVWQPGYDADGAVRAQTADSHLTLILEISRYGA